MQLSKPAVYAAVAAFLALFAAVFFLLGRDSRRRGPAAIVAVAAAPEPAPPVPSVPASPAPAPIAAAALPSAAAALPSAAAALPSAAAAAAPEPRAPVIALAPLPPLAASPPPADGAAAARDYFARMQAIQTIGPTNDTGEFANKLLTASMTGDMSGFDDLIKVAQAGAARAQAITPPDCCVKYHQQLLSMLTESVTMVQQLKTAISRNDSSALTALAASGSALQTRVTALEDQALQIKTRLGLAH